MTRNKHEKAKATTVQLGGKSEHQRPGTGTKKKQARFHAEARKKEHAIASHGKQAMVIGAQ